MSTHTQQCPTCGGNIAERKITLYTGMVDAMWRVFKWCEQKGRHEFKRKEIKHLLRNENDSARFGDLVYFSGYVFKKGKGHYGLNMDRCDEFFAGKRTISKEVWKDPITGEITQGEQVYITELPNLIDLLNEDGEYVTEYKHQMTLVV